MLEGRIPHNAAELDFYELALKASGAVQAARWSRTHDGEGYIYSHDHPDTPQDFLPPELRGTKYFEE